MHKLPLIALLLFFTSVSAFAGNNTDKDWNVFLDALWQKESSQRLNPPDGDGGKAIGPYQIWEVYWIDAKDHDKSLTANGETYQSCRDKDYAERVIKAYMSRWDRKSWTGVTPSWESKARLHNGGCNIYKKRGKTAWHNTTKYWQQVSKYMKQQGSK